MENKNIQKAVFAAGCFWGVEETFRSLPGVINTTVGYTGGNTENPTYEEVCTGKTGHAEAIQIEYDPSLVSYEKLLNIFWENHDPTTLNRQGPDVGTQYRSAIFYQNDEQKNIAEESKSKLEESEKFGNKDVVTEITKASPFYSAEEYHQKYLSKKGLGTCHI